MNLLGGKIDRMWWPFLKRPFLWPHSGLKHFVRIETEQIALCQPAAAFWPAFYASEAQDMIWTIQLRRHCMITNKESCCESGHVGSDMKDADIPKSVSFPCSSQSQPHSIHWNIFQAVFDGESIRKC